MGNLSEVLILLAIFPTVCFGSAATVILPTNKPDSNFTIPNPHDGKVKSTDTTSSNAIAEDPVSNTTSGSQETSSSTENPTATTINSTPLTTATSSWVNLTTLSTSNTPLATIVQNVSTTASGIFLEIISTSLTSDQSTSINETTTVSTSWSTVLDSTLSSTASSYSNSSTSSTTLMTQTTATSTVGLMALNFTSTLTSRTTDVSVNEITTPTDSTVITSPVSSYITGNDEILSSNPEFIITSTKEMTPLPFSSTSNGFPISPISSALIITTRSAVSDVGSTANDLKATENFSTLNTNKVSALGSITIKTILPSFTYDKEVLTTFDPDPFFKAVAPVFPRIFNDRNLLKSAIGSSSPLTAEDRFYYVTVPAFFGIVLSSAFCLFCWHSDCFGAGKSKEKVPLMTA